MTSDDAQHRRVRHELFDVLERGDVAAVDQLYAPDMTMWFNVTDSTSTREENLRALEDGKALHRRRTYDDRTISTFHDGFVAQYTCRVVTHDGTTVPLSACLVGQVHDGRIVHLAEYLDSGRFREALMDEYEIRELCEAFFDAYQDGRVDVLRRLLADDCVIWHNVFGRDTTRDENLAAYPNSYRGQRRRTYDDRTIDTFEDGFVIQYSLGGVMHTGHRSSMPICIVARCRDGQITRIDEYMDSSKFPAWMGTEA